MEIDLPKDQHNEEYENICCICQEPFTKNNIYTLKCNHFLCNFCFEKLKMYQLSLFQDVTCPYCRNVEIYCRNKPIFVFSLDNEPSHDIIILHDIERHVMAELYNRSINCLIYFSLWSFFFIGISAFIYWLNHCSKNPYASVCLRSMI